MSANDKTFEMFASVLRDYLPLAAAGPLDPAARLVDLGLDSLNTVEILVRMEEQFNVQFPDDDLTVDTFASVGSLWSVLGALVDAARLPAVLALKAFNILERKRSSHV